MGYLVRADVAVAQERMVPALGLTMTAMAASSPGSAAGVLNLMGNLGGVLSESLRTTVAKPTWPEQFQAGMISR